MEENIFGDIFGNLQQDSILIRQYDLDSFYGGASLKKVFERIITQEEASFLPEQEAYIFIKSQCTGSRNKGFNKFLS